MATDSAKKERIELRISATDKRRIQRAQLLSGDKSVSSFIARVLKEQTENILAQSDRVLISEQDRTAFFSAVMDAAMPNERLIAAAERYKREIARK